MLLRFWLCLLLVAACLMPALAEVARPAAAPAAASAPAAPAAISVADLLSRADADERLTAEVSQRIDGSDPVDQFAPGLDFIARSVDERLRAAPAGSLRRLPVMRLESLDRHWNFDGQRLERWQADLEQVTQPFLDDATELSRRRTEWAATRSAGNVENLPDSLVTRIDAVLRKLDEAERKLSVPLARQIELRARAAAVGERIRHSQAAVDAAIADIDRRLLRLDAPPLWAVRDIGTIDRGSTDAILEGLQIETRFAQEYSLSDNVAAMSVRVLQLAFLPLVFWLSWRARRRLSPDDSHAADARVLARPISLWLLLAMMALLLLETHAPRLALDVAMLIVLIPVLRLLPPSSRREFGPWPQVATGLYLLELLGFFLMPSAFLYRLYVLLLTMLALALTLWLVWRRRTADGAEARGIALRALLVGQWIAALLFVVSLVSNLLGNVSLAEMLTAGTIRSAYMALILYAAVTVTHVVLRVLLEGRASRTTRGRRASALSVLLLRLLTLAAVVGGIVYALDAFRILRPLYDVVTTALSHRFILGQISVSLGNILVFVLGVMIAAWASRLVRLLLQEEVLARMVLPAGVANSIGTLSYYTLLLLGLLVALSAAGFDVSQLTLLLGALGVGIGFGLQNVVGNFVAGLVLMFERPIRPGDVIDVSGVSGTVRGIGLRATQVRTFDGAEVVIPNGTLLSGNLTNWTLADRRRRVEIPVGVAYGSKPAQVIELLRRTAADTPGVAAKPEPFVWFTGFGASSLDFLVRAWCDDYDASFALRSELATRIHDALERAGIAIPFPQQDLHLRSVSDAFSAALRVGPDMHPPLDSAPRETP